MTKYVNADEMLKEYEHSIYDTTDLAEMLYYMPAADVQEVKHGRWVNIYGWVHCSVCHQEPPNESNIESNYCPNCGALMDLEGNNG